jgi:hypothetical protein
MFHVITVHWQDDKWIEPQLRYLERFMPEHRVYAALNGIDAKWNNRFFYAEDMPGKHTPKLNALAEIAREHAHPDDHFLFLDGDAFPIAPVTPALLDGTQLVAMRRDENLGQQQPHPAFCITPVHFWFDIGGDWRQGYTWTASNGEQVTDGGGNLLGILTERNIPWRPLLRSNRVNLDPLWFGIYGDVVYHHGAGFRAMTSLRVEGPGRQKVRAATENAVIPNSIPVLGRLERSARYRIATRKQARELDAYAKKSADLSDQVFDWVLHDDNVADRFLTPQRKLGAL